MIWEIRHVKNDGNLFGQWAKKNGYACKKTSSIKLIKNINGEIK
jgi:hypothetical protein